MRPSYCTPRGTDICEIKAGRGGDGTGAGATFTARDETFLCAAWIEDKAIWEMDCERSCEWWKGWPGGAKVGVLAVVSASVVVEVLGCEKGARASSFPSQRLSVGL